MEQNQVKASKQIENFREAAFKHADSEYKKTVMDILGVVASRELAIVETEESERFTRDMLFAYLEQKNVLPATSGFFIIKMFRNIEVTEVISVKRTESTHQEGLKFERVVYRNEDLRKKYREYESNGNYHLILPYSCHLSVPIIKEMSKQGYVGAVLLNDMEPILDQNERITTVTTNQILEMANTAAELGTSFIFVGNNYEYTQAQSHCIKLFKIPLPKQQTLKYLAKAWIEENSPTLTKLFSPSKSELTGENNQMSEQISLILLGTTIKEAISILNSSLRKAEELFKSKKEDLSLQDFYNCLSDERKAFLMSKKIEIMEKPETKLVGYDGLNEHVKTELLVASKIKSKKNTGATALVLLGAPGTGKTTWAVELGKQLNKPVVFLNIQSMYGALLGQTEQNLIQALRRIKAIGNVIVVIDEVDKIFKLNTDSSSSINAVQDSIRGILNRFLTEEFSSNTVFVFCGNRYTIPGDLTRQGRMIGVYYVPYPTVDEAWEIFKTNFDDYFSSEPQKAEQTYGDGNIIKKLLLAPDTKESVMTGAEIVSFAKQIYSTFLKVKEGIKKKGEDENVAIQKTMEYLSNPTVLEYIKENMVTMVRNSEIVEKLKEEIEKHNILSIRQLVTGEKLAEKFDEMITKVGRKEQVKESGFSSPKDKDTTRKEKQSVKEKQPANQILF